MTDILWLCFTWKYTLSYVDGGGGLSPASQDWAKSRAENRESQISSDIPFPSVVFEPLTLPLDKDDDSRDVHKIFFFSADWDNIVMARVDVGTVFLHGKGEITGPHEPRLG